MMSSTEGEFVPVMVPKGYVTAVYGFIAEQERKLGRSEPEPDRPADEASLDGSNPRDARAREWNDELVRRSWAESPRSMKLVLRHLADATGQWIPSDQLAGVAYPDTGNRRQLAGALGAWGHRCSSRYKVETWPFEVRWNHEIAMYEYGMEEHFAGLYRRYFD